MNTSSPPPSESGSPQPSPVQTARALLKDFQQKFAVFQECKPLAIGIDKQLAAKLPEVNRKILRVALGMHTNSLRYLKAMAKATERFDLEGNPAGEVTEAQRAHANEVLRERFKKDAEQRRAQKEAEEAERRRTEKLQQLAAKFSKR